MPIQKFDGRFLIFAASFGVTSIATGNLAWSQALLHQPSDNPASTVELDPALLSKLDDPFFHIVIAPGTDSNSLEEIVDLVQPDPSSRRAFVVHEGIGLVSQSGCAASRRVVVSFGGSNPAFPRTLSSNLFFSFFASPFGAGLNGLEVIAWDETNGTYNYYRFDRTGLGGQPLNQGRWKLRNRSSELDNISPGQPRNGCLTCHTNGGPVMKEFAFPWNNWHSTVNGAFEASYLTRIGPASVRWPVAESFFLGQQLKGAEQLEGEVGSSLNRFTNRLVEQSLEVQQDGNTKAMNLRTLLDSLFMPTELNLASSKQKTGLDGSPLTQPSNAAVPIPDSFFANIGMMRVIGIDGVSGVPGITEIFTSGLAPTAPEYVELIERAGLHMKCLPGRDSMFAWFGPEVSEFDNRMVDNLRKRGIIDDRLIAAVLSVDIETPLFSARRAALLKHVPDTAVGIPGSTLPNAVNEAIIESIKFIDPSDRDEFEQLMLDRLVSDDPVAALSEDFQAYRDRIRMALDPMDDNRRKAMLHTLFRKLLANRHAALSNPISAPIMNESSFLFPSR